MFRQSAPALRRPWQGELLDAGPVQRRRVHRRDDGQTSPEVGHVSGQIGFQEGASPFDDWIGLGGTQQPPVLAAVTLPFLAPSAQHSQLLQRRLQFFEPGSQLQLVAQRLRIRGGADGERGYLSPVIEGICTVRVHGESLLRQLAGGASRLLLPILASHAGGAAAERTRDGESGCTLQLTSTSHFPSLRDPQAVPFHLPIRTGRWIYQLPVAAERRSPQQRVFALI